MAKMIVEFEWDDKAGPLWMNMDNLKLLLYGQMYTKPELLNVTMLDHSDKGYMEHGDCNKRQDTEQPDLSTDQVDVITLVKEINKNVNWLVNHVAIVDRLNDDNSKPITWVR